MGKKFIMSHKIFVYIIFELYSSICVKFFFFYASRVWQNILMKTAKERKNNITQQFQFSYVVTKFWVFVVRLSDLMEVLLQKYDFF